MTQTDTNRQQSRMFVLFMLFMLPILLGWLALSAEAAPLAIDGAAVKTGRVTFTLDASGLPAGIAIAARQDELPLENRTGKAVPTPEVLRTIGRGPLLRGPLRIEATVAGQPVVAVVKEAARPVLSADGKTVAATAKLTLGPIEATVTAHYRDVGLIDLSMTARGDQTVDALRMIVPVLDNVDLAIPLAAAGSDPTKVPLGALKPAEIDGVTWSNTKGNGSQQLLPSPGVASPIFFGSGDRGWVVTATNPVEWPIDPALPSFEIRRDTSGATDVHVIFCNKPKSLDSQRKFACTIQVLPSSDADPIPLAQLWQNPPRGTPATTQFQTPVVAGTIDVATHSSLRGDLGSIELFRYLCGAPAGLSAVLRPESKQRGVMGGNPAADRAAIGRALLHGMAVDGTGIANRVDLLKAVRSLGACGMLDPSAPTQAVPFWRSQTLARYGEVFDSEGGFEVLEKNPAGRVYTTALIRPSSAQGGPKRQTLFVIVNEGDQPVREQFYCLRPQVLFGGANKVSTKGLVGSWDLTGVPQDSDWNRQRLVASATGLDPTLVDLEDGGYVAQKSATAELEVYGPIFIPAHGYRLLWGCGADGALPHTVLHKPE